MFRNSLIILFLLASPAYAGWSEPVRISPPGGYATPQIVAQGETLHVVAESFADYDKICYLRSTDAGQTWSTQRTLSDDSCQTIFPDLISFGSKIIALWKNELDYGGGRHNIAYRISTNSGQSWGQLRYVFTPGRVFPFFYSVSSIDSIISVIVCGSPEDSMAFFFIQSTNFGQSWSQPSEIFRAIESSIPALDGFDNNLYMTWVGCFSIEDAWETYFIKSTDYGLSWSNNVRLSLWDNRSSNSPSVYVDAQGAVTISWKDYKYSPYILTADIMLRQSNDSGQSWGNLQQATFNHFTLVSDLAASGDSIHLALVDLSLGLGQGSIYYINSTDTGVNWSEPYWLDGTLDDSAEPAIALSQDRIYVVWSDSRPNPDTNICCGLYLARWDPATDAIDNDDKYSLLERINLYAFPNPFNSLVNLGYSNLSEWGTEISIFDINGKLIKTLKTIGKEGNVLWDATDMKGNSISSGVYFAKAKASQELKVVKLVYLK